MKVKATLERSRELDQFYTNPSYAKLFYDKINELLKLSEMDIVVEPSAGSGSFFNLFDDTKRIGIDIDPKIDEIIKQDFLTWIAPDDVKIATIGNPPFGKNSSLAIQFFNKAASFSEIIAFILPKTFKKDSVINRLDTRFHLVYEESVPENSFIFDGKPYNVPCCSQIWIKKQELRPKIDILSFKDIVNWFCVASPESADFSIQRVGAAAGTIRTANFRHYSPNSHYFLKQHDIRVLDVFNSVNFDEVRNNTAGNPSISPNELIKLWTVAASKMGII